MSNLILDSLEIRNFRAFRRLRIERLARVNLIVGHNNIGKTCLLEALGLYYQPTPSLLWEMLETRKEGQRPTLDSEVAIEDQIAAIKNLFYGRQDIHHQSERIQIGSLDPSVDKLVVKVEFYREEIDNLGRSRLHAIDPAAFATVANPVPVLTLQRGPHRQVAYRFRDIWILRATRRSNCLFIPTSGMDAWRLANLWDDVVRTELEKDVLHALQIIAPDVESLTLLGGQEMMSELTPLVKLRGLDRPILLSSMGEGMNRIFAIALALVNVRGGMLLVDEIESSLHHSVHTGMWKLVFQVAQRLNVQVFTTTHSWDCIKGFQQAAHEAGTHEGMLISLRQKPANPGEVAAILFNERRLGVVTRDEIEVR